jgi:hypothetical protein
MIAVAGGESSMTFKKEHLGIPLEDWLEEEGILQEATESAVKKAMEWQLSDARQAGERVAKLEALRKTLDASVVRGGSHSAADVRASVKARLV